MSIRIPFITFRSPSYKNLSSNDAKYIDDDEKGNDLTQNYSHIHLFVFSTKITHTFYKFDLSVTRDDLKAMHNSKSLILCGNVEQIT